MAWRHIKNRLQRLVKPVYELSYRDESVTTIRSGPARGLLWRRRKSFGSAYWRGAYEPRLQASLTELLRPDSVFFDVGAHAGFFSLLAANICRRGGVHSFEPNPDNAGYIRENAGLNRSLGGVWEVHEKAVGNVDGSVRFAPGISSSTGRVLVGESSGALADADLEVRSLSLDRFCYDAERWPEGSPERWPTIVKVDVEGAAAVVIEGAKRLLTERPPIWIVELHDTDEAMGVHQHLSEPHAGYTIVDLDTNQPVALDKLSRFTCCVVATPGEPS